MKIELKKMQTNHMKTHINFDQTSHLTVLSILYIDWCQQNDLPDDLSADDLMRSEHITPEQYNWLGTFIEFWNKTQESGL